MKKLNGQEAWFIKEGLQVLLKDWSGNIKELEETNAVILRMPIM